MIKDLREQLSSLKNEHELLKSVVENQEQYTRRNCLLVHGIPEEQRESTDSIVLNAINEHLEEGLTEVDIERTHRIHCTKNSILQVLEYHRKLNKSSKYYLYINFLAKKRPCFPSPKSTKEELFSNQ